MKKIIFLVLVATGAWWYFIGGRTLSEESVRSFYEQQQAATLKRDPEKICALLDKEFRAQEMDFSGNNVKAAMGKTEACDTTRLMYQSFEELGNKMGGPLQIDYSYTLHNIELSEDKKSATVDVSYSLDIAGSIMNIRSRGTETIIQKLGKPLLLKSEFTQIQN